ncbi:MAG: hypothetical protein J3K34DRAFT_2283 [Monoraphidium minutum]|nr:MAG: hypothetical protein J3K34DRAFT_2283 [Monoraphidium minutum]
MWLQSAEVGSHGRRGRQKSGDASVQGRGRPGRGRRRGRRAAPPRRVKGGATKAVKAAGRRARGRGCIAHAGRNRRQACWARPATAVQRRNKTEMMRRRRGGPPMREITSRRQNAVAAAAALPLQPPRATRPRRPSRREGGRRSPREGGRLGPQ